MANHMEDTSWEPKDPGQKQSLDIALSISLAEYENMRNEIETRLKLQKMLERFTYIVVGVLLGTTPFIIESGAFAVLLFGSLLLFGISTSFFSEDVNIIIAAAYINMEIRPRLNLIFPGYPELPKPLMDWESFRKKRFLPTSVATVMTINRTILCFMPGLLVLFTYFYLRLQEVDSIFTSSTWNLTELFLITSNAFMFSFLVFLSKKVPQMYEELDGSNISNE